MAFSLNSLLGASNRYTLNRTSQLLERSLEKLSTLKRISTASDDASGMALAQSLSASARGLSQANQNISAAKGMLATAEGGYSNQVEGLQRMRELAVQAANGAISAADRSNLNQEFQGQVANIDEIAKNTAFGDIKLIDGSKSAENGGVSIQAGAEAGHTMTVNLDSSTAQDLGISGLDISSQEGAQAALDKIDVAIQKTVSAQARVGAVESGLESRQNANEAQYQNMVAAQSQVEDLDLPEAISENERLSMLKQAQILASKKSQQIKGLLINFFK